MSSKHILSTTDYSWYQFKMDTNDVCPIPAVTRVLHEDKTYVSTDMLCVQSVKNTVTVKCIARHPALHSRTQMTHVRIGRNCE